MRASRLVVNADVTIPAEDLSWTAVRSSGPGGQNVNKVASKVELRFDLAQTRALDPGTQGRLFMLARGRIDGDGILHIVSQVTRDQGKNLDDALERLRELVLKALTPPKPRRPTKPTKGSQRRRLSGKKHQGEKKQARRAGGRDDD